MALLTVVIPYVNAHEQLMERAVASVRSQTIPVDVICIEDVNRRGPAWARNEGVRQVTTPLVTFLDADDTLMPEFASKMITHWRPGRYVYCDHETHGQIIRAMDCIGIRSDRRHTVTSVIAKRDFERVGGFDEQLAKAEDVEFWFRCHARGVCGVRCPVPLLHYTRDHSIRRNQQQREALQIVNWLTNVKYGGLRHMGCGCDEEIISVMRTVNESQEGYVLVSCNWAGNRKSSGRATGTAYPRCGNGNLMWIDPRDQEREPDKYVIYEEPVAENEPALNDFTKAQLVEYAELKGIEVDERSTKAEIRGVIDDALADS